MLLILSLVRVAVDAVRGGALAPRRRRDEGKRKHRPSCLVFDGVCACARRLRLVASSGEWCAVAARFDVRYDMEPLRWTEVRTDRSGPETGDGRAAGRGTGPGAGVAVSSGSPVWCCG